MAKGTNDKSCYELVKFTSSILLNDLFLPYSLRKDYERIADLALTTPTNTQHLMELKEAMVEADSKELPLLEEKMVEARHRYYI